MKIINETDPKLSGRILRGLVTECYQKIRKTEGACKFWSSSSLRFSSMKRGSSGRAAAGLVKIPTGASQQDAAWLITYAILLGPGYQISCSSAQSMADVVAKDFAAVLPVPLSAKKTPTVAVFDRNEEKAITSLNKAVRNMEVLKNKLSRAEKHLAKCSKRAAYYERKREKLAAESLDTTTLSNADFARRMRAKRDG